MTTSGIWTAAPLVDHARQFRFRITMNDALGNPNFAWWANTCDRPKINIPVLGKDEYYLNSPLPDVHPGEIADFQPITMTLIDPMSEVITRLIMTQLGDSRGYQVPRMDVTKLRDRFG